ncbi:MAG: hypothetical protein GXO50_06645 [Chlorobi bacterium]|nr:hypothetical protein [Chlorobiota bacterium]
MAKKTLSEEAKELFASWKKEIENSDGDILDRQQKRDAENTGKDEQLKDEFKIITEDLSEKAKKAFEIFRKEVAEFSHALKEGTADLYKKAEIKRHAEQLSGFLDRIKSKSADKFKDITDFVKNEFYKEEEFFSEQEKNEKQTDDIENLINEAEEYYKNKQKT